MSIRAEREAGCRFQGASVATIAGAHFIHDVFTGFLNPMLPLLIERLGLSLTAAGSLTVFQRSISALNPFVGTWVDRRRLLRFLVSVSPMVSAVFMCLLGVAPSYAVLVLLLLVSGVSVSTLHVSAPVLMEHVAGRRLGLAMSWFMLAGELARTVAPLLFVAVVSMVGLEGLWVLLPVALAGSGLIGHRMRRIEEPEPQRDAPSLAIMAIEMRGILTGLFGVVVARSFLVTGVQAFLPTMVVREGGSLWWAGAALTVYELAGAIGALTSGFISDRIGRRMTILVAVLLAPPLMAAFLYTSGVWRLLALLGLGFVSLSTAPVMMAVVLENAKANKAAANGTYMALMFAVRAMVLPLVGVMGDAWGLRTTFLVCAVLALIGLPFLLFFPARAKA